MSLIWTFITSRSGRYVLGLLAILAVLAGLYYWGRTSGIQDIENDILEGAIERHEERNKIDDSIDQLDNPLGGLLDNWSRD